MQVRIDLPSISNTKFDIIKVPKCNHFYASPKSLRSMCIRQDYEGFIFRGQVLVGIKLSLVQGDFTAAQGHSNVSGLIVPTDGQCDPVTRTKVIEPFEQFPLCRDLLSIDPLYDVTQNDLSRSIPVMSIATSEKIKSGSSKERDHMSTLERTLFSVRTPLFLCQTGIGVRDLRNSCVFIHHYSVSRRDKNECGESHL